MAHMSSTELRRRLESLPQELYNEIYDLTFTAAPNAQTITRSWKPPHLLRIDRTSRLKFADSYFRGSTFIFHLSNQDSNSYDHACSWLGSQSRENLEHVKEMKMILEPFPQADEVLQRARLTLQRECVSINLLAILNSTCLMRPEYPAVRLARDLQMVLGS